MRRSKSLNECYRNWIYMMTTTMRKSFGILCIEAGKRCVVILSNDVRAEPAFPALVQSILGDTGLPWAWEYGSMKFWPAAR